MLIAREIRELIVEQEEKERLERGAEEELNRQCGDGTVQKVEVLQHGDEPVIEPVAKDIAPAEAAPANEKLALAQPATPIAPLAPPARWRSMPPRSPSSGRKRLTRQRALSFVHSSESK